MTSRPCLTAAVLAALAWAPTSLSADTVKIGVVQGLSGPPAITDFGESYLQGIKSAVKDYDPPRASRTRSAVRPASPAGRRRSAAG